MWQFLRSVRTQADGCPKWFCYDIEIRVRPAAEPDGHLTLATDSFVAIEVAVSRQDMKPNDNIRIAAPVSNEDLFQFMMDFARRCSIPENFYLLR